MDYAAHRAHGSRFPLVPRSPASMRDDYRAKATSALAITTPAMLEYPRHAITLGRTSQTWWQAGGGGRTSGVRPGGRRDGRTDGSRTGSSLTGSSLTDSSRTGGSGRTEEHAGDCSICLETLGFGSGRLTECSRCHQRFHAVCRSRCKQNRTIM